MKNALSVGVKEAAVTVLHEAGGPLHAREIAKRILERNIWQTKGKTPHATVAACLYADITKRGDASPFILAATPPEPTHGSVLRGETDPDRNRRPP